LPVASNCSPHGQPRILKEPSSSRVVFGSGMLSLPRFANCAAVNSAMAPVPNTKSEQLETQRFCELSKANPAGRSRKALSLENCGGGFPLTARAGGSNSFTDGPKIFGTHKPSVLDGVEVAVAVGEIVVVAVAVSVGVGAIVGATVGVGLGPGFEEL
jgi:hypothetical protein